MKVITEKKKCFFLNCYVPFYVLIYNNIYCAYIYEPDMKKRQNLQCESIFVVGTNFVVSTKCIIPWVLEFVVSNIRNNKLMEKL